MSSQAREKLENKNVEIQHIRVSLTIQLNMSLLQQFSHGTSQKKVQVRDWSHSRPQSLIHNPLEQSSVRLYHKTKTCCLGVLTLLPITKSLPIFSTSIQR